MRKVGKGKVYSGMSANDVLAALGVARDWAYTKPEADTTLMFVHRKLDDGDIYFVDNRQDRAENVDTTFRVEGKAPELWDPATGTTQPVSYPSQRAVRQFHCISTRLERLSSSFASRLQSGFSNCPRRTKP
jgi:hypothetical protein